MTHISHLLEDIYGHQVIGFHRTNKAGMANLTSGHFFLSSSEGTYGPGIYLTYDFESQQTLYMIDNYGEYIIKCRVFMNNFLILDPPIAQRIYGDNWHWISQLEYFLRQMPPSSQFNVRRELGHVKAEGYPTYTSGLARILLSVFRKNLSKYLGVSGLVFTGRQDGHVIVTYDSNAVTPLSWIHAPNIMKNILPNTLEWHSVSSIAKDTLLYSLR